MRARGSVRDAIIEYLERAGTDKSVKEISAAVAAKLGTVGGTSVRAYLRFNAPSRFERNGYGRYRLARPSGTKDDKGIKAEA
jgi:hypothetical protein